MLKNCQIVYFLPPFCFTADIWLLGDSILYWAGVYVKERSTPNLTLPNNQGLGWYAIIVMSWTQFIHSLQLRVLFQSPPMVVLIHLVGNDLSSRSILQMFNLIRRRFAYVTAAYPEAHFIWVDILQRLRWTESYQAEIIIESKRRRVNRFGRALFNQLSKGHSLVHDTDIQIPGLYRDDGTHLSDIGIAMYLDATWDALINIV